MRRKSDAGRMAVIWLATAFVIVIGSGASAFVIVAGTGTKEIEWPMIIWGAAIAGLVFTLISLSMRWDLPGGRLQTWLLAQNRNDPTDDYRAARRRIRSRERDELGNNQPPSVESVRDAANHGGAWVPRSEVSEKHRASRRK